MIPSLYSRIEFFSALLGLTNFARKKWTMLIRWLLWILFLLPIISFLSEPFFLMNFSLSNICYILSSNINNLRNLIGTFMNYSRIFVCSLFCFCKNFCFFLLTIFNYNLRTKNNFGYRRWIKGSTESK